MKKSHEDIFGQFEKFLKMSVREKCEFYAEGKIPEFIENDKDALSRRQEFINGILIRKIELMSASERAEFLVHPDRCYAFMGFIDELFGGIIIGKLSQEVLRERIEVQKDLNATNQQFIATLKETVRLLEERNSLLEEKLGMK